MRLLENLDAPYDLSDIDSFPWLWAHLTTLKPQREDYAAAQIVELSLALAARGQFSIAEAGVIEICRKLDLTLDRYLQICLKLCEVEPEFLSTGLLSQYLRYGGADKWAFEQEMTRLYCLTQYEGVITLFRKSAKWFCWTTIDPNVLFVVANSFGEIGNRDQSFNILKFLVDQHPDSHSYRQNMAYLGMVLKYEPAGRYVLANSQAVAERYVDDIDHDAIVNGVVVDIRHQGEAAIISTLKRYGLCHVKNGVDPIVVGDLLAHVESIAGVQFPMYFTPHVRRKCDDLMRFDAASVINAVLASQGAIDDRACVIRRVDPANDQSFTPFHQDATAFLKGVVNVWTPLTPAGGDYPTMEFVKRRINNAEQTLPGNDEYHLVRIDDQSVLERYKGEFYEPHDLEPGDCIIFLGTTIHRSTKRKGATKTRYSLEIRWS